MTDYNPISVLYYKWGYSWQELKQFYVNKQKDANERMSTFCEFLVELVSAALGGGKSSEDAVGLDAGEGLEEMTDEQLEMWRCVLGEKEFQQMYGHLIE